MQDKATLIAVNRNFGILLLLFALCLMAARIFAGMDFSPVIAISLMTIGIANLTIAQTYSAKQGKPD